jgi:phosphate:Na+ symporter
MIEIVTRLLGVIGSLGVFLFGMKLMSESLQKVAGFRMRSILAAITSNKFKSISTGLVVTAVIQSSSATTVMIVSFVNAGLLSLTEAVGMIMGANIGTTLKVWLFVAIGFNFKATQLVLPLVAICFPLLFSRKNLLKYWGEFALGFAFIFFGLDLLYASLPHLISNATVVDFLGTINNLGVLSVALFVVIGASIAALFQSSSAALVFTLSLSSIGIIDFTLAAAMVIGENIGTTITANIAALIANEQAKKAARVHFLFNIIGATWVLAILPIFLGGIDQIIQAVSDQSAYNNPKIVPWALALIHTTFNLSNVLIQIWFIPILLKLASKLVKHSEGTEETLHLSYIRKTIFSTSEISILQARNEILMYSKRIKAMYKLVKGMFNMVNDEEFNNTFNQVSNYETICDQMETEITSYLTKIGQGELSSHSNERLKLMLNISSNLENIADNCYNIAKTLSRKRQSKVWFTQDIRDNLNRMFQLLEDAIEIMHENLTMDYESVSMEKAEHLEDNIDQLRNSLKEDYASEKERGYKYEAGVIYNDIYTRCERLGDNIYQVTKTIVQSNRIVH